MREPPLDPRLVQVLVKELERQAGYALELIEKLRAQHSPPNEQRFWRHAQGMLGAMAICSKILWPAPRDTKDKELRKRLEEAFPRRGDELRKLLGVEDDFLKSRDLRNSFEHIDERFEEWALDATVTQPFDAAIIQGVQVDIQPEGTDRRNIFRRYDNGVLRFWHLEQNLEELRAALEALRAKAAEHLRTTDPAPGEPSHLGA